MGKRIEEFPSLLTASNSTPTKPVPSTPSSGVALTGWHTLRPTMGWPYGVVFLSADAPSTLTGPVNLYGFDGDTAKWYRIGTLNGGQDVVLTATVGHAEQFNFPAVFDRLSIAATVSAGNVDDRYMPLTEHE